MQTQRTAQPLLFQDLGRRQVCVDFDGGVITSHGGALLLREADTQLQLSERLAACFTDTRDPARTEFSVETLVLQRIMGLCLGYEDLVDHDRLRCDPLLAVAVGIEDLFGEQRRLERDQGAALAGKSTLQRLENAAESEAADPRYHTITVDFDKLDALLLDLFVEQFDEAPEQLVIDLDATDVALHGHQQGRFFHGYYGHYCYLPLYITCGDYVLRCRLREANIDASKGAIDELEPVVRRLRAQWPDVKLIVRADSGFSRDELYEWLREHDIDYIIGIAKNERLVGHLAEELAEARAQSDKTGHPVRLFRSFSYRTLDSWSRARRVIGKAEALVGKDNPRFVVTSLEGDPRELYEELYCARGEMENRIKEQQLDLFADRASAQLMKPNELRMYWSVFAHHLMVYVRRRALAGTRLERATPSTIRLRLLRIGARVTRSVRRIRVMMSSAYVDKEVFRVAALRLTAA